MNRTSTRRVPVTVCEMLQLEFLLPLSMSVPQLAEKAGLDLETAEQIATGTRRVDPEIAAALSRAFGNSPDFWLRTQQRCDDHLDALRDRLAEGATQAARGEFVSEYSLNKLLRDCDDHQPS